MKRLIGCVLALVITAAAGTAAAAPQVPTEDQRDLRARLEERYEVVPFSDGLALRPKARSREFRLIEVAGGAIMIDGVSVTGRELRDRVGEDAELIVRLSYLDDAARKALFSAEGEARPEAEAEALPQERDPEPPEPARPPRARRSHGDRVRILGSVSVDEDERVDGQAVAVLGSVRIDGEVTDQVVAVLGSVELGPKAVVGGDIVSVGGRVRRAQTSQVRGSITEVAVGQRGVNVDLPGGAWAPMAFFFGPFGAMARLVGSLFHLFILALLASVALLIARVTVERSAERVAQEPLKSILVGIAAQILTVPVFVLAAIVLAVTIIGIPLLLLLPFAALFLVLLALVGFSGTALTIGRMVKARFGGRPDMPFAELLIGVAVILTPLLLGRLVGLAGWAVSPLAFLLIAAGLGLEYLAWASGFGAVLTNAFTRWQARRGSPPAPESATV